MTMFRRLNFATLVLALSLPCLKLVLGDNVNAETKANATLRSTTNTPQDDSSYHDDLLSLAILSLCSAYLISLIVSTLSYVSYLEYRILMRYLTEASPVEARVLSTTVARNGTVTKGWCVGSGQKEYNAIVEYEQIIQPSEYRMKVRKQVGALEGDFINPHHRELTASESPLPTEGELSWDSFVPNMIRMDAEKANGAKKHKIIFNQDSFFKNFLVEERTLELVVIDGIPKSGYPSRQHARKTNWCSASSSYAFLSVAMVVVLFCMILASRILFDLVDSGELRRSVAQSLVFGFLAATGLQVPCVHLLLYDIFQQLLEEEFFQSGDLMQTAQDDSTLSSRSDVNLFHHYKSSDSCL